MWKVILIVLIIFIFFFPIPIRISLTFNNGLTLKVFNIKINLNKNKSKQKKSKKTKDINYKKYLENYLNIKNKPNIKIQLLVEYGFEDAYLLGISYGYTNIIFGLIKVILTKFFNLKSYHLDIKPIFNKNTLNLKLTSIISISLAKILYIVYKIIKN